MQLSSIKSTDMNIDAQNMIDDLIIEQCNFVLYLKSVIKLVQAEDDEASVDLLIQRLSVHEKNIWLLKSNKLNN